MERSDEIKKELFDHCLDLVEQRISNASQAMQAAQESANMEEKSSAGDKYETGRAMAQLERDKAAQQLNEAMMLKSTLSSIKLKSSTSQVTVGSLVTTDLNHFFIAISLGKLSAANHDFFVIAPSTPIGRLLMGLHVGNQFIFNNQVHTIREIL
jgi:transcription elongation GreA/GreB family factor